MSKFISAIIILSMCFLSLGFCTKNLEFYVAKNINDYTILNSNKNASTIKVNDSDYDILLKQLSIEKVNEFIAGDSFIIEGYTSLLPKFKVLNGRKVNIQISVNSNYYIVGYPLINGSF